VKFVSPSIMLGIATELPGSVAADSQGLTLVHFSAQPEPFLTQSTP